MRGSYDPKKLINTSKTDRGWLERQEAAKAKMAGARSTDPDGWRAVDAERRKAYEEAARRSQIETDKRMEANARLRVTCPCCGSGAVPVLTAERVLAAFDRSRVDENRQLRTRQDQDFRPCPVCDGGSVDAEKAERIVAALAALPADYEPFSGHVQILIGVAQNQPYHGSYALRVSNGAIWPRRCEAVAGLRVTDAPGDDESAIAAYRAQDAKTQAALTKPVSDLEAKAVETADEDAVLAAVRAAEHTLHHGKVTKEGKAKTVVPDMPWLTDGESED